MGRVRLDPCSRLPLDPEAATSARGGGDPAFELIALRDTLARRESPFVELCARTHFSFLSGASSPEALVARAAELGYDGIAITDRDGLYGIVRAHEEGARRGVRVIVGCELTIDPEGPPGTLGVGPPPPPLVVLVESHEGYTHLCRILTESHARHPKGGKGGRGRVGPEGDVELPRNTFAGIPLSYVCAHSAGLWAIADARHPLGALASAFGPRLSVGVHLHRDGEDRARLTRALDASRTHAVPLVATNRVLFARPDDKPLFDVLTCVRECKTLDEAGRELLPNAEAHLKSAEVMVRAFGPQPEAIARSRRIADACTFSIKELRYRFPSDAHGTGGGAASRETPDETLRRLVEEGARERYDGGAVPAKVRAQIDKELALIAELEVAPYFLSVRAIVDMARRRKILCQGRGSAANSAVCFCLGITAVDPARSNLLFERFLSAERREPPDIDVDFEHERREEVIQEIYETYGRERAAMVSEVNCYRGKSALREVGKVFGLSLEQVDRLSGVVSWWDGVGAVKDAQLRAAGFSADDVRMRQVLAMSRAIQGFPRHISTHVGGFVLSATPLSEVAPVEPATMPGRTVVPWDKDDLDTLGFFKVDVLGLGMLTAIRKALVMVHDKQRAAPAREGDPTRLRKVPDAPSAIDLLAAVPAEDPEVYDALCRADTVGVFQIESRAQMAMLPRLRPRSFYDLVIEVAIVRPGPIQGGMVHPYLRRRNGEEPCDPPHEILSPILERTLGVPLFQEQVMEIAIKGAGYTGGEADQLRRDMAAWRKNGNLARHEKRLADGFAERGIDGAFAARLYQQIQGFGEYGFPESHAASFALLVYASSWLKVHHPAEFAAALVNSQPMGFYSPSTLLQDAQRHGVELDPIRVEHSAWDCEVTGARIRLGLRLVSGLGEDVGRRIEAARRARAFESVEDLARRADVGKKELGVLAESGALDDLTGGRRQAIWDVAAPRGEGLFEGHAPDEVRPALAPLSRSEQLVLDYERTGVSVADHPMLLLRPRLPASVKGSRDVLRMKSGARVTVAGLVICRQRPMTASGVVFATLEDEHGFINLVLWARVFEQHRHVATTASLLLVKGKLDRSGAVVHVVVDTLERLDPASVERTPRGRHPRDEVQAGAPYLRGFSRDFR